MLLSVEWVVSILHAREGDCKNAREDSDFSPTCRISFGPACIDLRGRPHSSALLNQAI